MTKKSISTTVGRFVTFRKIETDGSPQNVAPPITLPNVPDANKGVAETVSKAEVKKIGGSLYDFGRTVYNDRKKISIKEFAALSESVTSLTEAEKLNLCGMMVTALKTQYHEVLEIGTVILYADYLVANFDDSMNEATFRKLLRAKVVIPKELAGKRPERKDKEEKRIVPNLATQEAFNFMKEVLESKVLKDGLEKMQKEIAKAEKIYQRMLKKQASAVDAPVAAAPAAEVEGVKEEVQKSTVREKTLESIPIFEVLQKELSKESYILAKELNLFDFDTFGELNKEVQSEISRHALVVAQLTLPKKSFANQNGVLIPLNREPQLDTFAYRLCPNLPGDALRFTLTIALQNGERVQAITYTLADSNGVIASSHTATFAYNGQNSCGIMLFPQTGIPVPSDSNLTMTIRMTTDQGNTYLIETSVSVKDCVSGEAENIRSVENPIVRHGVTNLGIAEYKKIEQTLCRYVAAEVSDIQNIMAREFKERATRYLRRSETTVTTEKTTETEKLKDTSSSERHEMNQEISNMIQESRDFGVNAGVKYGDGTWSANLDTSLALHNNREQTNRRALSDAKELTERALDRIVQKVREERIQKIIEEFEENNKHGFDNRQGSEHISGVFRFVDKIMTNEIHNYGKRLMYEFMIPEPAKLHKLALDKKEIDGYDVIEAPVPFVETVGEGNYVDLANRYGAEVDAPPVEKKSIGKTLSFTDQNTEGPNSNEVFSASEKIDIPQGYFTSKIIHVSISMAHDSDLSDIHLVRVTVGDRAFLYDFNSTANSSLSASNFDNGGLSSFFPINMTVGAGTTAAPTYPARQITFPLNPITVSYGLGNYVIHFKSDIAAFETEVPVSACFSNYYVGTANIVVEITRTQAALDEWQIKTTNAIKAAYEEQLAIYQDKIAAAKRQEKQLKSTNPGFYRDVEKIVLKKNCIAYLLKTHLPLGLLDFQIGNTMESHAIKNSDDVVFFGMSAGDLLDYQASLAKFMEQAFEWEIMSYQFYPFYWGGSTAWKDLYNFECDDKLFSKFMQSGMGRVILTVRPGFEEAVMWFMATGEIWNGGNPPLIDDELYISIDQELADQEYTLEGTWESRIPTTLTVIQSGTIGLDAQGLPCCDDCCEPENKSPDTIGQQPDSVLTDLNVKVD